MKSGTVPCVCTNSVTVRVASVSEELYMHAKVNAKLAARYIPAKNRRCGPKIFFRISTEHVYLSNSHASTCGSCLVSFYVQDDTAYMHFKVFLYYFFFCTPQVNDPVTYL